MPVEVVVRADPYTALGPTCTDEDGWEWDRGIDGGEGFFLFFFEGEIRREIWEMGWKVDWEREMKGVRATKNGKKSEKSFIGLPS